MKQLININDWQGVNVNSSASSPKLLKSTQTSSIEMNSQNSYRSPPSAPNSNNANTSVAEFLRLTPVNLNKLSSPTREGSSEAMEFNQIHLPVPPDKFQADSCAYRENFKLISKQLEKLLNDLNIVYKEIGYSNAEITSREKRIFNRLSTSISSFFYQADEEKTKLIEENESCQEVLRRILQILKDPRGSDTIPDLYTRNSLLGLESQSPNKKPISLLNRKRILSNAKQFVIKTYAPKLLSFLESSVKLRKLIDVMPDFQPETNQKLVSIIPPAATCNSFKSFLSSHINDIEESYKFIMVNKNILLQSMNFADVSDKMVTNINEMMKSYQQEYSVRTTQMTATCQELLKLIKNLGVDIMDLDDLVREIINDYTQRRMHSTRELSLQMMSMLEKVVADYHIITNKRQEEKHKVVIRCENLWDKLKISPCYIEKFKSDHCTLSFKDINAFERELDRLETMKKKLIKHLLDEAWERIVELWDLMHFTPTARAEFTTLYENMKASSTSLADDENVLETCEQQIKLLEKKYGIVKPMLELVDKFKKLHESRLHLEDSSKDSSRLLSRNSHKILLQEEKIRKKIARHFPTVIQELRTKLLEYSNEFNEDFTIDNTRYLDIVNNEQEQLIAKYPRMRFSDNSQKAMYRSKSSSLSCVAKKDLPRTSSNPCTSKVIAVTPLRHIPHRNEHRPKAADNAHLTAEKPPIADSFIRALKNTNNLSPPKRRDRIYAKNYLMGSSPTKIPTLSASSRSAILKLPRVRKIQPLQTFSQLATMSSNRLNKQSSIPMLAKNLTHDLLCEAGKENSFGLESPAIITKSSRNQLPSSPMKEKEQTTYTSIPEEHFKITASTRDGKADHPNADESSIMEDGNFIEWKRSQLAKLSESPIKSPAEVTTPVNWENNLADFLKVDKGNQIN
ncbi:HBR236Wp [Eremothecium sinecaudum]|uniref:HBR236Wp n=1 Tax=Eremothecium sinecaudum TaxID=45286 RepID=A0A109UXI1_9SACH|nr:HBR236Wp [Eremothecium sinecaudum]AMD19137.1 HBR236Wp [Eremothecium sinecaudum]